MLHPVTEQTPDEPSQLSPTYQLADLLLREQGGIRQFVLSRRLDGMSWRKVARDVYLATGERIDVAHETLRNWFPGDEPNGEPEAKAS